MQYEVLLSKNNIADLGTDNALISLPYEIKEGEISQTVAVWVMEDDSTLTKVESVIYDEKDKKVTFSTNRLSKYVIG